MGFLFGCLYVIVCLEQEYKFLKLTTIQGTQNLTFRVFVMENNQLEETCRKTQLYMVILLHFLIVSYSKLPVSQKHPSLLDESKKENFFGAATVRINDTTIWAAPIYVNDS